MITLNKKPVKITEVDGQYTWPLIINAESTRVGLDSEIFVYHAAYGDDSYLGDVFECVASVQQMNELPVGSAVEEHDKLIPYYRRADVTFYASSAKEADDLWEDIKSDVDDLVLSWQALNDLALNF